ncbi:MAG: tetratricopeptide repeat protein, partial [bacterium]
VEFDDPAYVSENPFVRRGLTWDGVRWAFTTGRLGNWNPLTWLSYMLDVSLFGVDAGAQHLVNLAFHLANTLLLFALLARMTRAAWPSAVVAALFGLHPLHVESVAWIAERKDVLSTLCWFLLLWSYLRYVETRAWRWYAAALLSFGLGLMAKPMLVTAPFALLLLDIWPLGRVAWFRTASAAPSPSPRRREARRAAAAVPASKPVAPPLTTLLLEKAPLLLLTIAFSAMAYAMQVRSGAVAPADALPLGLRLANALVAYVRYLMMALWPADLAVLYPFDTALPSWQPIAAALCLLAISAAVLRAARRCPYALVGWLWYLGTLVPVIGLVQIGSQALADRYTYVPLLGIFIIVAWGGRDLAVRWAMPAPLVGALSGGVLAVYAAAAWAQVGVWRDGVTLLSHTVRVTGPNCVARNNLGVALAARGEVEAAEEAFREALRIKSDFGDPYNNIGLLLWRQGRREEAAAQYRAALQYGPYSAETHSNLGLVLNELGRRDEAIAHLTQALEIDPSFAGAHVNLGNALRDSGRPQEAIAHYEQALRLKPDYADAYNNLGATLAQQGQRDAALAQLRTALRYDAGSADVRNNLALLLAGLGQADEAIAQWRAAARLQPQDAGVRVNLANALHDAGQDAEAIEFYEAALQLRPDLVEPRYHLGVVLTQAGRSAEAIDHFRQALQRQPDYAEAHNDLGVALVDVGQLPQAIDEFQQALRLKPDYSDAQYNLDTARDMASGAAARPNAADAPGAP